LNGVQLSVDAIEEILAVGALAGAQRRDAGRDLLANLLFVQFLESSR